MSDMSLHHDLYGEATGRRHREAEEWTRSRALQRDARSARARSVRPSSRRMRALAVATPMVAVLTLLAMGVTG
jgi:hypothetical protein